jgi:tetratricopeptide (TPR) repeat protein
MQALALTQDEASQFQSAARQLSSADVTRPGEGVLPTGGFLGALPSGMLVARDHELRTILSAVDAVAGGAGRLVTLTGEPGVGKTRLAQEVTVHLRERGFLIAGGSSYEADQSIPYYAFLDPLTTILHSAPAALRAEAPKRWPYLGAVLRDEVGLPEFSGGPRGDQQPWVLRAVARFVGAVAEHTAVAILLDDLHWADSATLELLLYLSQHTRSSRVLLLGCYRDLDGGRHTALATVLQRLAREELVERIAVRCLGEDDTRDLIAATLGAEEVSQEFTRLVHSHTDGNPFFVQQVIRMLVDRGDIFRRDGSWDRKDISEIHVPETVRIVIGQRLARLAVPTQETLREASVLGQVFGFDDLQGMADRTDAEIESVLDEAAAAGLVTTVDGETYAFDHALTQNTLYHELSPRRRRKLHLAVGDALERLPEQERAARAAELVWHFLEAVEPKRALPHMLAAGEQAESVFAHSEAEHQFRMASTLARGVGDGVREAEALENLGGVFRATVRHRDALATLAQAAEIYRATGNLEGEARATAQIGWDHLELHTEEAGIASIQPLLEALEERGPPQVLAELYVALAGLFARTHQHDEALKACRRASELARSLGDDRLLVAAEGRRGLALVVAGDEKEALRVLGEVIPLAEATGDFDTLFRAATHFAALSTSREGADKAMDYLRRGLDVAERMNAPGWIGSLAGDMAYHGNPQEARTHLERALEMAGEMGLPPVSFCPLLLHLGDVLQIAGEWLTAQRYLNEVIALSKRSGDVVSEWYAQALLAWQELWEERPQAAIARLEPYRGAAENAGWLFLIAVVAEAYAKVGDVPQAEATLATAVGRSALHMLQPVSRIWTLRTQGMILSRQQRWREAENTFAEAVSLGKRLHFPEAEAHAQHEFGLMHLDRGATAQAVERLEEARAIFRRLDARPYIERTERVLAKLEEGPPN